MPAVPRGRVCPLVPTLRGGALCPEASSPIAGIPIGEILPGLPSAGPRTPLEPELSVVVPAYHDADSIAGNKRRFTAALEETGLSLAVLPVVDGDPKTFRAARRCPTSKCLVLGSTQNGGKGFALHVEISRAPGALS